MQAPIQRSLKCSNIRQYLTYDLREPKKKQKLKAEINSFGEPRANHSSRATGEDRIFQKSQSDVMFFIGC
uniref:Uncharacterized protein n=1 Tax=Strigamia maritima TaxID=126957 RepID=T1IH05_STRMM